MTTKTSAFRPVEYRGSYDVVSHMWSATPETHDLKVRPSDQALIMTHKDGSETIVPIGGLITVEDDKLVLVRRRESFVTVR